MTVKFEKLKKTIIKCNKCPRLVKFRKKISTEKRKQYMNQTYWGKPVTCYWFSPIGLVHILLSFFCRYFFSKLHKSRTFIAFNYCFF